MPDDQASAAHHGAADQTTLAAQILDANPVPCFVIDARHRIIHWNKGCEQLLGIPASTVIGTNDQWRPFYASPRPTLADFIVDRQIDELASPLYQGKRLRHSQAIQDAYEAEAFFPDLGAEGRQLFFTAAPIRNVDGDIIGAVETLQDVTAQRQAEAALQASHDHLEREVELRTAELAEANCRLAASLHKAEAANRAKSAFLATISHELKTPLNGIIGIAELIRIDPAAVETAEYAAIIHESGRHLFKHLNDMLSLTEIEAGEAEISITPNSTRELIESVLRSYRPAAEQKGLALEISFAPSTPEVIHSDALRLADSLAPLFDNAVKYTGSGKIKVDVEAEDGDLLLTVTDTGPGIPVALQEIVFEKFRQVGSDAFKHHSGMGLGLALARAQAERLGGTLTLGIPPAHGGARFVLRVPANATR
ncbi:MAG: ATP-binding protein [Bacteroidota bacterium]